jgi:hypothetical protein
MFETALGNETRAEGSPSETGADPTAKLRTSTPRARVIGRNNRPYCTTAELDKFFDDQLVAHQEQTHDTTPEAVDRDVENHEETAEMPTIVPLPPPRSSSLSLAAMTSIGLVEPKNYHEAVNSSNQSEWMTAIDEEIAAHQQNGTWQIVQGGP